MKKLGHLKSVKRIVQCDYCQNWFEITEKHDLTVVDGLASELEFRCPECTMHSPYERMKKERLLIFEEDE